MPHTINQLDILCWENATATILTSVLNGVERVEVRLTHAYICGRKTPTIFDSNLFRSQLFSIPYCFFFLYI